MYLEYNKDRNEGKTVADLSVRCCNEGSMSARRQICIPRTNNELDNATILKNSWSLFNILY